MGPTSFQDLPYEVQEYVAQHLDQWDLKVCVGVSQAWRTLFHPHLWRHVNMVWHSDDTGQSNTLTELKANGHLIHSLKLTCDDADVIHEYFESCPPSMPLLTSLEVKGRLYGGNGEFEDLIKRRGSNAAAGGWKRLVFCVEGETSCHYDYGAAFFDTLIQYAAPTLEVLQIKGASGTTSADINRLLCSAPNLKEFWVVTDGMNYTGGNLEVQDIVNSDWICTNLEVFACPIAKVPRPDITRSILGQPAAEYLVSGTVQESVDLQHGVYAKLARLTQLRELRLGVPLVIADHSYETGDKEWHRQYGCLAMTLNSGLDLLKGLTNLRVVDLSDMEVYVNGYKEQNWFAEHWPNATIGSTDYTTDRDYAGDDEDMEGVTVYWPNGYD